MLVRLDLSKYYDRLSWTFLFIVLRAFRFAQDWICWIKSLISTPFFSIILNGAPSATFISSWGLRQQGDPIPPPLFIIASEFLGHLIKYSAITNQIKGLRISGMELTITHQQFVNDNLLYGEPTAHEALSSRWHSRGVSVGFNYAYQ